jgi:hypothetical protein
MNFLAFLVGTTIANLIMAGVYENFDPARICFVYAVVLTIGYPLACFINRK